MSIQPQTTTPEPASDVSIIERILAGETSLFELLIRRYNQRMYRAVRSIVRNDAETEDVMQQAYVNAFTHLRQFAGNAAFSTWLTRIAVNEALARIRPSALHLVEDPDGTTMDQIESATPDPERQTMTNELKSLVETEIAALPEHYRSVLMLREVEGLSTSETAECLSVAEDVVKTRLHRARTMLRDNLYRHAGLTFEGLFTFGHARCDRMVEAVMSRIGS